MENYEQLSLWEEYVPKVNDYVVWERDVYGTIVKDEGWVYFKADEYITIETGVKPRPDAECEGSLHKYIHTLLLCHNYFWCQLKYVKSRQCKYPKHYSECEY